MHDTGIASHEWGAIVLDAQAVSLWLDQDRRMLTRLRTLAEMETPLVVCANTIIELARHPAHRRLDWFLLRARIEPVTRSVAQSAATLLRDAGMSGHSHAIDASVAAVALEQPSPSAIMTSDPDDMYQLCDDRAYILRV